MPEPTKPLKLWYKFKSLKLPWRRKWLCGYDLSGNTFWEFIDPLNPYRPRRIVHYPRTTHYGDVGLSPAWLQWLRKTRPDAPSVTEQQYELQRQGHLAQLAARADQRWREQESFLDKPQDTGQPQPLMQPLDKGGYEGTNKPYAPGAADRATTGESREAKSETQTSKQDEKDRKSPTHGRQKENPWDKMSKGPSEGWQPQAWSPGSVESR